MTESTKAKVKRKPRAKAKAKPKTKRKAPVKRKAASKAKPSRRTVKAKRAEAVVSPVFAELAKKKRQPGRRPSIQYGEPTLRLLHGFGMLQCTVAEAAVGLQVCKNTLFAFFKKYPDARAEFDDGRFNGHRSLRRYQYDMAEYNSSMAQFLGKNWLGQKDKSETVLMGPDGGAIETITTIRREIVRPQHTNG